MSLIGNPCQDKNARERSLKCRELDRVCNTFSLALDRRGNRTNRSVLNSQFSWGPFADRASFQAFLVKAWVFLSFYWNKTSHNAWWNSEKHLIRFSRKKEKETHVIIFEAVSCVDKWMLFEIILVSWNYLRKILI